MTDKNSSSRTIIIIAVVVLVLAVLYSVMNTPDRRTTGEKMGDAVSEFSDGAEDAGRALQDRTPAEQVGDAMEDAGDRIERSLD